METSAINLNKTLLLTTVILAIAKLAEDTQLKQKKKAYVQAMKNAVRLQEAIVNGGTVPANLKITSGMPKFWANQLKKDLNIIKSF